jgi:hypothetical protein
MRCPKLCESPGLAGLILTIGYRKALPMLVEPWRRRMQS